MMIYENSTFSTILLLQVPCQTGFGQPENDIFLRKDYQAGEKTWNKGEHGLETGTKVMPAGNAQSNGV